MENIFFFNFFAFWSSLWYYDICPMTLEANEDAAVEYYVFDRPSAAMY